MSDPNEESPPYDTAIIEELQTPTTPTLENILSEVLEGSEGLLILKYDRPLANTNIVAFGFDKKEDVKSQQMLDFVNLAPKNMISSSRAQFVLKIQTDGNIIIENRGRIVVQINTINISYNMSMPFTSPKILSVKSGQVTKPDLHFLICSGKYSNDDRQIHVTPLTSKMHWFLNNQRNDEKQFYAACYMLMFKLKYKLDSTIGKEEV